MNSKLGDFPFKDYREDEAFIGLLSKRLEKNGGARVGDRNAWFEIGGQKYIYITYAIFLPAVWFPSDEYAVEVFAGLLEPQYAHIKNPQYVQIRSLEINKLEDKCCFYIRAVQVFSDSEGVNSESTKQDN